LQLTLRAFFRIRRRINKAQGNTISQNQKALGLRRKIMRNLLFGKELRSNFLNVDFALSG
jgi:hypothetical protein